MRILVAAGESNSLTTLVGSFEQFGAVDIVQDGRAAVVACINANQTSRPYHLVFLGQRLAVLKEEDVIEMIRVYEEDAVAGKTPVTFCCVSDNSADWQQSHQARYGSDRNTHFYPEPANSFAVMSLLKIIANQLGEFKPKPLSQYRPVKSLYA